MKRFVASADSETDENIWETVEAAYVYIFPLVLMDATETSATNTEESATEKAPVNQFIHSVALADAQFKTVVTPNVDTIYSQVWYDLSEEPMVYELPETDRFCKVQVLDGWTNTAAVLDKAGAYAITLSTWEGELPEGVTRIDVPTSMAWSITRIILSGEEDLPNVYAIQEKMKLMPLSDYISGDTYEPPRGSYSEENDYIPVDKVLSMDPITFFNKANELMVKNSPAAADKEMLEKIAVVNIGPGMEFDISVLTGDVAENWKTMLTEIQLKLIKEGQKFSKKLAKYLIMITAFFMPQNAFLHATYFTLRSGGKTIITFLFDSVFIWCISVPIAFVLSRYTGIHVLVIYACVQLADLIKCVIGFALVKKGVWLQNIVS